jgi:hypothetical protein
VIFAATVRYALPFGPVEAAVANNQVLGIAVWLLLARCPWSVAPQAPGWPGDAGCAACPPARFLDLPSDCANAERFHPDQRTLGGELTTVVPEDYPRAVAR